MLPRDLVVNRILSFGVSVAWGNIAQILLYFIFL